MGSTFFDLGFLFFNERPESVVGNVDKTGTINLEVQILKTQVGLEL